MANYINPNGREAEYDFAKANRYPKKRKDYDHAVYAQDQDGVCYHFLTIEEAAEAVVKNGYCKSESVNHNQVCGYIVLACNGGYGRFNSKSPHRIFGFDWHFVSDIH